MKKHSWIAYILFAIIMVLIYIFIPRQYGFITIIIVPLVYWFIYDFIIKPKQEKKQY